MGYGQPQNYQAPVNAGNYGGGNLQNQPAMRVAAMPGQPTTNPQPSGGAPSLTSVESESDKIDTSGLLSILRAGGSLMFPILLCSFVLVVFILERLLFLRRGRIIPKPFVRGVIEQLEQQQLDQEEALALCEDNGSPTAELFTAALKRWGRPAVEMEQAVMDAGAHITSQLKKYLRLFNAISNLTPLLGLLGTVLGMIDAFNSIAQADAMGRPELLASGIGAALLTTAFGLCVAIPAYTAYVYFLGRTDKLILEMDALVANVVELTSAEAQQSARSRSRSRKAA
ncbi:MAG: MotA/TolQ/ExbB proton channel family protein [Pirellulaceae bacterium]|nr:MotA/TolQ/ExbB proton channel family protein [Pirellulaceae bacterium]